MILCLKTKISKQLHNLIFYIYFYLLHCQIKKNNAGHTAFTYLASKFFLQVDGTCFHIFIILYIFSKHLLKVLSPLFQTDFLPQIWNNAHFYCKKKYVTTLWIMCCNIIAQNNKEVLQKFSENSTAFMTLSCDFCWRHRRAYYPSY